MRDPLECDPGPAARVPVEVRGLHRDRVVQQLTEDLPDQALGNSELGGLGLHRLDDLAFAFGILDGGGAAFLGLGYGGDDLATLRDQAHDGRIQFV